MGERQRRATKRTQAPSQPSAIQHPRVVRWLQAMPAPVYLLCVVLAAGMLVGFSAWLEEGTRTLAAAIAFSGLLVWWTMKLRHEWRDSELVERSIGILGCLLLLGASGANLVRFLLLR